MIGIYDRIYAGSKLCFRDTRLFHTNFWSYRYFCDAVFQSLCQSTTKRTTFTSKIDREICFDLGNSSSLKALFFLKSKCEVINCYSRTIALQLPESKLILQLDRRREWNYRSIKLHWFLAWFLCQCDRIWRRCTARLNHWH